MHPDPCAPAQGTACGPRLRQAREAAGLSREDVSARLKMQVKVLAQLESDDWSALGAPVFVRGQLRSYARLFGLDIEEALAAAPDTRVTPPVLVSHTHTPRVRRIAEQVARRAIYIAVTAAIAVPVWMATSPHLSNNALESQPLDGIPAVDGVASAGSPASAPGSVARTPLVASFTSLPRTPAEPHHQLSLTFKRASWVQVFGADGRVREQATIAAGQVRRYAEGEVGRVVIGDSSAVEVRHAGQSVDLGPFSRANVARFTLSSDGSVAPANN